MSFQTEIFQCTQYSIFKCINLELLFEYIFYKWKRFASTLSLHIYIFYIILYLVKLRHQI